MLRTEQGLHPLEIIADGIKVQCQYKARDMPKMRLSAIANGAVWEKVSKGRAGTRWDNAVDEVCKEMGGNQDERYCCPWRNCEVQDRRKRKETKEGQGWCQKRRRNGKSIYLYTGGGQEKRLE